MVVVTRSRASALPHYRHCSLEDLESLQRKLKKGKFVFERETNPLLELLLPPSQEEVVEAPPECAGPETTEARTELQQAQVLCDEQLARLLAQDWERQDHCDDLACLQERQVDRDVSPVESFDELVVAQQQSLLDQHAGAFESETLAEQQVALDAYKQLQELAEVFDEEDPFAGMSPEEKQLQLVLLGQWK